MPCPTKQRLKRKRPLHSDHQVPKRQKTDAQATWSSIKLERTKAPVAEPWPTRDLHVCALVLEMTNALFKDVLTARSWQYSDTPCHAEFDKEKDDTVQSVSHSHGDESPGRVGREDDTVVWVKEFEASVRGESPQTAFGKKASVQEGYQLKERKLPSHMMWMLPVVPFRTPSGRTHYFREDFANVVVDHRQHLGQQSGQPGNYRIAKFPGTANAVSKTNLTIAFRGKSWYPETLILPKEKNAFLQKLHSDRELQSNYWIGKPRNDYGGNGISVWKGTDPICEQSQAC